MYVTFYGCVFIDVRRALYWSVKTSSTRGRSTHTSERRRLSDFNFLFGAVQEDEVMATLMGPESPWMGGKKRTRNRNIITRIRQSQIAGRGFSRGTQVNGRICAADRESRCQGSAVMS